MVLRRVNWPVVTLGHTPHEVKHALLKAFPDVSDTTLFHVVYQSKQLDSEGRVTELTTAEHFEYWLERSLQENNVFRFEGKYWKVTSIFFCILRRDELIPYRVPDVTPLQANLLGCMLPAATVRQWGMSTRQEIINLAKGYPPHNLDVIKTITSFKRRYATPAHEYVLSPLDICQDREQLIQVACLDKQPAFEVPDAKGWLARNLNWLQSLHFTATGVDTIAAI